MSHSDQASDHSVNGHKEAQIIVPTCTAAKAPMGARKMPTAEPSPFRDFSWPNRIGLDRGTVTLVALCFVTVMGITLAGYIAVCSRAMNLSNRTFQGSLSKQLAEAGLDEALRAFNKNDWSDWSSSGTAADWTVSGTTATCNLTFPASKFGQGVTGSVKIRVDNYNAAQLDSTWNNSTNYRINDLVGYNGIWYRCVQNNANQTPGNLAYWVQNPIPWTWSNTITYSLYDVVNYNGAWYRYINSSSTSGNATTNTNYWAPLPSISLSWSSSGISYGRGTILNYSGAWYYCITSHTSSITITPTNTTYWAPMLNSSGAVANPSASTYVIANNDSYVVGNYVYRDSNGYWYRCVANHTLDSTSDLSDTALWEEDSKPYISWAYRSGATHNFNRVVYYPSGMIFGAPTWYRCKVSSTTAVPTTAADWENALTGTMSGWSNSSINYNLGDTVYYNSTSRWYRCIRAHTSNAFSPPTNTTNWVNAPLYSTAWDSNRQYSQYDTVRYNGQWYLSLQNNNYAQVPTTGSSTYWAVAPQSLSVWDATINYSLNALVSYSGTWYRCILPHTTNQVPTNTTYWAVATGAAYAWDSATACTAGVYRSYRGVWYKCATTNTGQSPNNTTYWTAAWVNSHGVTTGAPVVYAEGTIDITGSPSIKTQLRATIAPAPLFPNAAAATTTISANSGGTVDSYDSTLGTSYASQVSTATNYSAVVAAGSTSGTAVTLSSTAVKGYAAAPSSTTSPYAPLFSSGGSVKGLTSPVSPNIDLTRISRSPSIPQFDTLPVGGLAATWANVPKGVALALSTTTSIGTPGATTPSRYYYDGNLTIGGGGAVTTININGPVIIHVNGDLIMDDSPNGIININSTGSAEVHIADSLNVTVGSEGIKNLTLDPKKLILLCDTTTSSSQYYSDGSNAFYGVIYLPNTTNSSGLLVDNSNVEIYGAISAKEVTYSGANMNIHYDTSLRHATFGGVDQPYTITEWRELPATEQATMP